MILDIIGQRDYVQSQAVSLQLQIKFIQSSSIPFQSEWTPTSFNPPNPRLIKTTDQRDQHSTAGPNIESLNEKLSEVSCRSFGTPSMRPSDGPTDDGASPQSATCASSAAELEFRY